MLSQYPFAAKYYDRDGVRLHYVDEGSGPAIVMVHGNPTWSYYYRNVISLLSKCFRVIAFDHIGCGLSDKPQDYDYSLARRITDMEQLLNYLAIDRFSLIAHDWGGAIGLGCGLLERNRLDRVVLMNTAAFRSTRIPRRIALCKIPVLGEFLVRGLNGFAGAARYMAVEKSLPLHIAQGYLHPYGNWNDRIAVHRFVQDIPLSPQHQSYECLHRIENRLASFDGPMLLLWGGRDFCFNDHFFRRWLEFFPAAEAHYFAAAGHYVLEDAREEVEPLIESFFRRVASV